ncbi:MAG: hypothetical protein NTY65_17325 [Planctomycetota bacterium]|nr:hypothetical protein [Planctomycetota bacterium]
MPSKPSPPVEVQPDPKWPHYKLYTRVRDAVTALPLHFKTETVIAGIMATDLFTLAAALGATIEQQVVDTLNDMREVWDPEHKYELYHFYRQSQTFPDVLLRKSANAADIIMGLELKGWYLLAKESEPSFRFLVTPKACNPQDLIVVVPWALSNVISGTPRVFDPYMVSAQFAANYRNYHWQHLREAKSDPAITSPAKVVPYPQKSDAISDKPKSDDGKNFGRFSRTGLMDDYLKEVALQRICGIEATHWRTFFKAFQEQATPQSVQKAIERFVADLKKDSRAADPTVLASVQKIMDELKNLVSG